MAESKGFTFPYKNAFPAAENAPGGECADKPVSKVYRKAHGYQKQEL